MLTLVLVCGRRSDIGANAEVGVDTNVGAFVSVFVSLLMRVIYDQCAEWLLTEIALDKIVLLTRGVIYLQRVPVTVVHQV